MNIERFRKLMTKLLPHIEEAKNKKLFEPNEKDIARYLEEYNFHANSILATAIELANPKWMLTMLEQNTTQNNKCQYKIKWKIMRSNSDDMRYLPLKEKHTYY